MRRREFIIDFGEIILRSTAPASLNHPTGAGTIARPINAHQANS
jgi:hypothetical protein